MSKRIVVTGLGVVSANGCGIEHFLSAIQQGKSGIKYIPELKEHGFGCQIGGIPDINDSPYNAILDQYGLVPASFNVKYACTAGLEAWKHGGLSIPERSSGEVDDDTGIILGSGIGSADIWGEKIVPYTNENKIKRLKSTIVEHSMFSGPGANLANLLALGNQISTVSSACASGSEAIILGYQRIKSGQAKRMLVGGSEPYSPYGWAGFDAMRVLTRDFNENPEEGSRPMSASASGFVPGAGAGVLLLEELESAEQRNATIYAEICGGFVNSGGQRNGGTMTAPNPAGVKSCIDGALKSSGTSAEEIDCISGHLSSTMADVLEIKNWAEVLGRKGSNFPYINSLKSMVGHCIGAAGAIETIASVLEIYHSFIHPTINCEDLNTEIAELVDTSSIPSQVISKVEVNCIVKASFGFGDVNACLILKKI